MVLTATCNPACQNGGQCISFNVCQCSKMFCGAHCQFSKLPNIFSQIVETKVNNHWNFGTAFYFVWRAPSQFLSKFTRQLCILFALLSLIDFLDIDRCNVTNTNFNGNYKCSYEMEEARCTFNCPQVPGLKVQGRLDIEYKCNYQTGHYRPATLPKCIFRECW